MWSGEATRNQGFAVEETRVDVSIGDNDTTEVATSRKDRPVWMTESTIITNEESVSNADSILEQAAQTSTQPPAATTVSNNTRGRKENEDIMSVLLQHEKQPGKSDNVYKGLKLGSKSGNSSDSSDDEKDIDNTEIRKNSNLLISL